MKSLTVLVLTLATAFALPSRAIKSHNIVVPAGRIEGRITRGQNAVTGQFPYQVGLSIKGQNSEYYWCGGSILNNEWVLTAAHCTENARGAKVLLGATTERREAEVIHDVNNSSMIIHKGYDTDSLEHDISLIKIPYTKYSKNIQPVKLPAKAQSYSAYSGDNVIASGWGHTSDSAAGPADKLQWARLMIIPNTVCERNFEIFTSNICTATFDGVNICNGDSGGPLVLEHSKIQIGLTSFGDEICMKKVPAVYTRVASYLDWIEKFTGIST